MPAPGQPHHQSPGSALADMLAPITGGLLVSVAVLLVYSFIRFACRGASAVVPAPTQPGAPTAQHRDYKKGGWL